MSEYQDLEQSSEELSEMEAVEQAEQASEAPEQIEDEIDPRYRGKSIKDIIKMHQEAEKLIGKHAQEVGEVRRLADELIKSQLTQKTKEEKPPVDFFENPEEAVKRVIESSPDVKQAREMAMLAKQEMAKQELLKKHPDAFELVKDEDFVNWIKASKVRTQLAIQADQQFDVDAADELYSTYKALRKPAKAEVDAVEKANRQTSLRKASVDTGGSGESSKKVYRRADIIQLKLMKPQEFEARRAEIEQAYLEGRVR